MAGMVCNSGSISSNSRLDDDDEQITVAQAVVVTVYSRV